MTQTLLVYGTATAVAVLTLLGAARALWRRAHHPGDPSPSDLRVVGRARVGVGRSLVIVDVDGRRLLLGSTRQQWTALAYLGAARDRGRALPVDSIEAELARAMEATRRRRQGERP
jgi:flagellar biogenesis protein FliO